MNKLSPSSGWCNYIQIYILKWFQCNCQYEDGGHTPLQNVSVNLRYSVMAKPVRPHNMKHNGFGGLGVACCLSVPKFAGSTPAEAVRIFQGEKILSTPSFRAEVKPSVPCRRFAARKRSLNWRGSRNFRQNYRSILAHTVPPFATTISRVVADVEAPGSERGNVQTGGGGGQGEYKKPSRLQYIRGISHGPYWWRKTWDMCTMYTRQKWHDTFPHWVTELLRLIVHNGPWENYQDVFQKLQTCL